MKKCDQCQRYFPNIHQPRGVLNPLSSPWSFAQWGLDIVGPFPKAAGNRRRLLVGTDYFTKWVEAEPLSNIRDVDAKRFVWKNIVTRFGIPHTFISDNGLQFDSKEFRRYCGELGITNRYSTLAYPQGNGQVKAVNKVIVRELKKRLDDSKGSNDNLLEKSLDLIKEQRKNAMVKLGYYQQKLKQGYDLNVKLRPLAPGDLVLRKVLRTTKNSAWGKLGPNWEGPYRITSVAGIRAYFLEDLDEKIVP
ncbi:uncharacterized protein LOC142635255 [Castanea sativa]|uniref:uncharacterized protein LOC142635255 n=1 Tax=Castanea sativa TaxID=21020 RepID=UPI003F64D215